LPPLKTALALEIIFQASARELFPGVFREAEIAVKERASGLMRSLMRREETKVNARKVEGLQRILSVVKENDK